MSSNGIGDDDDEGEIDLRANWCGLISRLNSRNPLKWRIGFAMVHIDNSNEFIQCTGDDNEIIIKLDYISRNSKPNYN